MNKAIPSICSAHQERDATCPLCNPTPYEAATRPPLTHVAIRFQGKVWSLPRPYRHHHIIRIIHYLDSDVTHVDVHLEDQGFLDAAGRFLNRNQAEVNAHIHKQIKGGKIIGGVLTSEDLW
jgi:hypothetical protein